MKNEIFPRGERDSINHKDFINHFDGLIHKINFFESKYRNYSKKELTEYYDWFLHSNLIHLYSIGDALNINSIGNKTQNNFNLNNPFFIWAYQFNQMKHGKMANDVADNSIDFAFLFANPINLKHKNIEFSTPENIGILHKAQFIFWNPIMSSWPKNSDLQLEAEKKINFGLKIRNFLEWIKSLLIVEKESPLNNGEYFDSIKNNLGKKFEDINNLYEKNK